MSAMNKNKYLQFTLKNKMLPTISGAKALPSMNPIFILIIWLLLFESKISLIKELHIREIMPQDIPNIK
jgi:hypothetical protein